MLVRTFRQVQGVLSVAAPIAAASATAWQAWSSGLTSRATIASGILLAFVIISAVCLRKRAVGRETAFFNARIAEDPPGEENEPVFLFSADVVLVVVAVLLVITAFSHAAG
jgi:hypothetical protein